MFYLWLFIWKFRHTSHVTTTTKSNTSNNINSWYIDKNCISIDWRSTRLAWLLWPFFRHWPQTQGTLGPLNKAWPTLRKHFYYSLGGPLLVEYYAAGNTMATCSHCAQVIPWQKIRHKLTICKFKIHVNQVFIITLVKLCNV